MQLWKKIGVWADVSFSDLRFLGCLAKFYVDGGVKVSCGFPWWFLLKFFLQDKGAAPSTLPQEPYEVLFSGFMCAGRLPVSAFGFAH